MRDRSQDVDRLADLLVGFGANIQPGQILGVTAYHGMEELAYAVTRAGYKRGAKYVDVFWWDQLVKRQRLEFADESTLDFVPPWFEQRMQWLSDEHAARVSLTGTSASVFEGLDPARTGRDLLPYIASVPRVVNERTTNWTVGPSPNLGWAERVHPELDPEAALDKLWDEMVYVLRLDSDDPVEAWHERMKTIVASADRMTERRFDALHLQGPGTDLTIGLMPSSKWLGADFKTIDDLTHYPNLPTEEVFTTPDPERVDGHVSATMPLELYGSYINGIRIEFESGRAVKIDADQGADALRADRRARRRCVAARRDRARRQGRTDRPARHRLLRDAARRERGQPHRARQCVHVPGRGRRRSRACEQERHPRRLHDRLERGRRGRDHRRRRPCAGSPRRFVADLVEIVPYDPAWPAKFEAERAQLLPVLAPWLTGEIHHVGSTSVPGLGAKAVIDILAEVASLEESRAAIEPLRELSYWWFPYQEERMNWFCKPSPEHRTHHLHLVVPGSEAWREELAFRDALRAEPETARAYEQLKRRLAAENATDREAYTVAKTAFVESVLARVL